MSRPITLEDFEAIRDAEDGHRYELIDGSLIATPAPSFGHQRVSMQLTRLLLHTMPDSEAFEVLAAPFDVHLGPATVVQPDILVITDEVPHPLPILAIEVLSPSTRHVDVGLKWSRYAAGGRRHYWVVDPEAPSITAWRLDDGYVEVGRAFGDETLRLSEPWLIELTPAKLTRRGTPY